MANKALVIDVKERSKLNGVLDKWETLGNMDSFTRDIITPTLDENADKSAIVSGIPSVFARANMFSLALSYTGDSMSDTANGMMTYYTELIDEWFGLISAIALDSGKFTIRKIELTYSDGKDINETSNVYETKGALGNMLFERSPLWKEQNDIKGEKKPFINVIKYNGQVVGGTSPECLLFTAPSYSISPDPRYAPKGKFVNPVKDGNVGQKDWLALYAYVKNLIDRLNNDFTLYYQKVDEKIRPNYNAIAKKLSVWLDEIRGKIIDDVDKATANPVSGFTAPFSYIFNYSDDLYGSNGSISSHPNEGYTAFKAEDLMLPRSSEIARIILSEQAVKHIADLPVQLLTARIIGRDTNEKAYFALPLSVMGLKVFGSGVSALIGQQENKEIKSQMTAEFDPNARENNLTVYLTIITEDGKTKNIVMVYTVKSDHCIKNSDILLWPNFISHQWNTYFMYSELPHAITSIPFNAVPFVGDQQGGNFLPIRDGEDILYLTDKEERLKEHGIISRKLITCDHRVSGFPYKYEIYQSNKPFAGVKLTSGVDHEYNEKVSGFLLVRYTTSVGRGDSSVLENLLDNKIRLNGVRVGFDFGSTNSSVAFFNSNDDNSTRGSGLKFANRRVSLFNADNVNGKLQPKDFFFFPKKETESNALKSTLTLHDQVRLPDGDIKRFIEMPVAGGVPCFMSNLPIKSVTSNNILLDFGGGIEAKLVNNMKWSDSEDEKNYKKAYLKTVLLMIYAELFKQGLYPKTLNWSYPSTMVSSMVENHYGSIWDSLGGTNVSPIVDIENNYTIPLEVTRFANQIRRENANGGGNPFGNAFDKNQTSSNSPFNYSSPFDKKDNGTAQPFSASGNGSVGIFGPSQPSTNQKTEEEVNFEPDDPAKKLDFHKVNTDYPMTEACASANFTSQWADVRTNIVFCFDVGGSTTDISALYVLNGRESHMIKQNSVRFAARNVAITTRYMPDEFKKVLSRVCDNFNIRLIGFNVGDSRYCADTAPYYYEQIVDTLTVDQLGYFYDRIAEFCPRLFAVNMYVTGLIMFYAGQLSRPLYAAVQGNLEPGLPQPRGFQPIFEGKGARIFDWLSSRNYPMAESYFKTMFKAGAQAPDMSDSFIDLSALRNGTINKEVKFEVSKGLALANGKMLEPAESFEIFGEDGFKGHDRNGNTFDYDFSTKLTPRWMREIGGKIRQDTPSCECFKQFLGIYYNTVTQTLGITLDLDEFVRGMDNMKIEQYITQDLPRFKEAMERTRNNPDDFDYVAPIIIIEGMKFYDKHLLKCFK